MQTFSLLEIDLQIVLMKIACVELITGCVCLMYRLKSLHHLHQSQLFAQLFCCSTYSDFLRVLCGVFCVVRNLGAHAKPRCAYHKAWVSIVKWGINLSFYATTAICHHFCAQSVPNDWLSFFSQRLKPVFTNDQSFGSTMEPRYLECKMSGSPLGGFGQCATLAGQSLSHDNYKVPLQA